MLATRLSQKTLDLMGVTSAERWSETHEAMWHHDELTFYSGLKTARNSAGILNLGEYFLGEVPRSCLGPLAKMPGVPDPCVCVFRLESAFRRGTGPVRVNGVCSYYPEALAAAGISKTERLALKDVVLANDRMELAASAVLGRASTTGEHEFPLAQV
jgi:hypothetical protein